MIQKREESFCRRAFLHDLPSLLKPFRLCNRRINVKDSGSVVEALNSGDTKSSDLA